MRAAAIIWHKVKRLPAPLIAASGAGWALLAIGATVAGTPQFCVSGSTTEDLLAARLTLALAITQPGATVMMLAAMLLAMTPPLLAPPLLHVWRRSLTRRRIRTVALFLSGYVAIWFATGLIVAVLALLLHVGVEGGAALGFAALTAAVWQTTPLKQISLNRCHGQPPLAAFGLRADIDALAYGAAQATACVGACWALMFCALAASGIAHGIAIAAVTGLSIVERASPPRPAGWGAAAPRIPTPLRPASILETLRSFAPFPSFQVAAVDHDVARDEHAGAALRPGRIEPLVRRRRMAP